MQKVKLIAIFKNKTKRSLKRKFKQLNKDEYEQEHLPYDNPHLLRREDANLACKPLQKLQ
jgi:hypothetical protein